MELHQTTVDPGTVIRHVEAMIAAGRIDPARHLLAAARTLKEQAPELALLSIQLAIGEGRSIDALDELDTAIADASGNGGGRKRRIVKTSRRPAVRPAGPAGRRAGCGAGRHA